MICDRSLRALTPSVITGGCSRSSNWSGTSPARRCSTSDFWSSTPSAYETTPSRRTSSVLEPSFIEVLEPFLDVREEAARVSTIDQPMVVAETQVAHRTNRYRIVYHDGAFLDGSDAEDGDLRLVDQRQPVESAEDPGIGDGESSALHFIGIQLLRSGAAGQIVDAAAQPEQVLFIRLADHRHDQPVVEGYGDAEVDVLLVDDILAVDGRVHHRELPERVDDRFRDE